MADRSSGMPGFLRMVVIVGGSMAVGLGIIALAERAEEQVDARIRAPDSVDVRIRVEVLNGGGRQGMARAATDDLRDAGFDVVALGNAQSFDRDSSVVLDRVGQREWAGRVAEALGISTVETQLDSTLYLDVTVLLGAEWEPLEVRISSVEDEPEFSWWDLRRFFR